jgi:hypothetical protein
MNADITGEDTTALRKTSTLSGIWGLVSALVHSTYCECTYVAATTAQSNAEQNHSLSLLGSHQGHTSVTPM